METGPQPPYPHTASCIRSRNLVLWGDVWPAGQGREFCLSAPLTNLHLQGCIQVCGPQCNKGMELLQQVQRWPWRCAKGCSTSAVETSWENWRCSAWRRLQSDLTVPFSTCRGPIRKLEVNFSRAYCNRKRYDDFKVKEGGWFILD